MVNLLNSQMVIICQRKWLFSNIVRIRQKVKTKSLRTGKRGDSKIGITDTNSW